MQECADRGDDVFKIGLVIGHNDKVISITQVVLYFQFILYELIKLIEAHVSEKLGGQVAYRQSFAFKKSGIVGGKTPDDFLQQPQRVFIPYPLSDNAEQHLMVNRGEKLFDVALESKTRPMVIPTDCPRYPIQCIYSFMRSLPDPAGKGIGNERRLKDWIQRREYGMV